MALSRHEDWSRTRPTRSIAAPRVSRPGGPARRVGPMYAPRDARFVEEADMPGPGDEHRCGCAPSLSPAAFGLPAGLSRRELFRGMTAALSLALAGCTTIPEQHRAAAADLAREQASVDLH